ncbi:MAG: NAD(P)/FAD-dependent oxidoreductase [Verrucomicrobiia bacterium]
MIETKVVIVGAGPAGLAAAIQLRRCSIQCVLLEKSRAGGLLWEAKLIDNYPRFFDGISGPQLARQIAAHAIRMGVTVVKECVSRVDLLELSQREVEKRTRSLLRGTSDAHMDGRNKVAGRFHVATDKNEYQTDYVVVASGTAPCPVPLPVPAECTGRVHSNIEALRNVTNKRIAIVGAGDAAFDYALNLVKNRNSVTILNRSGETKCLRLLFDCVLSHPSISYRAEWPVSKVEAGETGAILRIRSATGETIEADFMLFAIGRIPRLDFLAAELLACPPPGLFLAGDVKNGLCRQAIIAAGEGLRAAMEIYFDMQAEKV